MDPHVRQFRAAAARENLGRVGLQRRYSPTLRARAVRYWGVRRQAGEGLRDVAVALGVAPWSLHRWAQRAAAHARVPVRFAPVQVEPPTPPEPSLVVVMDARGLRVEGLGVEMAAQLLALLR
jgi:transposase-like protein